MRSIIVAVALVSSVSLAQQPEVTPKSPKPPIQNLDLTGTTISGEQAVPLGHIYVLPTKPKFGRLLKVRMNFDDKLRESVHEM